MDTQTHDPTALKWMDGSSSSKSYVVVARRGDIALGLKLNGLFPSEQMKVPGKTYLAFRLRSARHPELFAEENSAAQVVQLTGNIGLDEAWPNLTFDTISDKRASVTVGALVAGSMMKDPAGFVAHFDESGMIGKVIDYVCEAAGLDNVIVTRQEVVDMFRQRMQPSFEKMVLNHQAEATFAEQIDVDTEVVGLHSLQMKKIYEAIQSSQPKPSAKGGPGFHEDENADENDEDED